MYGDIVSVVEIIPTWTDNLKKNTNPRLLILDWTHSKMGQKYRGYSKHHLT